MLSIHGKVKGVREVVAALNKAPGVFVRYLSGWLVDERSRFLGGKGTKDKSRTGYRDILRGRRLSHREGTWAPQVVGVFKGYIPGNIRKVDQIKLRAGVGLNKSGKIHRALEQLQTGGTVSGGGKRMSIPVYKNLAAIGITRGFWQGKAFRRLLLDEKRLIGIKSGTRMLWFDKSQAQRRYNRRTHTLYPFPRSALLFVGRLNIRQRPQFTGRYDFYGRWNRMLPAMISRGQSAVDRATKAVQSGRLD